MTSRNVWILSAETDSGWWVDSAYETRELAEASIQRRLTLMNAEHRLTCPDDWTWVIAGEPPFSGESVFTLRHVSVADSPKGSR